MNFNQHSELRGRHAVFAPSVPYWMNDNEEEAIQRYCSSFATSVGTALHSLAEDHIKYSVKMTRFDKKYVPLTLLKAKVPASVVDRLPVDDLFDNLMPYVNDSIGFRMTPEVVLYYSDIFFGTTDAIHFDERERLLRINDFKSGSSPAKMDQLIGYDALFRLEYCPLLRIRPEEIRSELRIYQFGEVRLCEPESDEVISVMNHIKALDKTMSGL